VQVKRAGLNTRGSTEDAVTVGGIAGPEVSRWLFEVIMAGMRNTDRLPELLAILKSPGHLLAAHHPSVTGAALVQEVVDVRRVDELMTWRI
jgi:hypothetical protein